MIFVTATENFIYGVHPSVFLPGGPREDALARIMALAATCETDFKKLRDLFAVPGGFGATNRVTVSIDPTIAAKGKAGWNGGYKKGDANTEIQVVPFSGDPNADAFARFAFVAEMSEVFMDYRNMLMGPTWIENHSDGEALSLICSAELHPEGVTGARSFNWLNAPEIQKGLPPPVVWRPNYVDFVEDTDGNPFSFGCGVLFINYMRFQLGISLGDIITKAGHSLAETYRNVTGKTDGWASFSALMNATFPITGSYTPATDNLFPLPQLSSLTLSPSAVSAGDIVSATLKLDNPHPGIALTADLVCTESPHYALLPMPPKVTIPQNSISVNFSIPTPYNSTAFKPVKVSVSAAWAGVTVGGSFIVNPTVVAGILQSVTLNPAVVNGGQTCQGTVTLEGPVDVDTVVGLAAVETGGLFPHPGDASSVARVTKPSVTIKARNTSETFTIDTSVVAPHTTRTATILANAVVTKTATLEIQAS